MSDNWIAIIPCDPEYVPSELQMDQSLVYLEELAPDSDEISFSSDQSIKFRDCGANFETVYCRFCMVELDQDWWAERMDEAGNEDGFVLRPIELPCCHASSNLNDLVYSGNQGFSRVILEAMNPKVEEISSSAVQRFSELLGTEIKVIYQHI